MYFYILYSLGHPYLNHIVHKDDYFYNYYAQIKKAINNTNETISNIAAHLNILYLHAAICALITISSAKSNSYLFFCLVLLGKYCL